MSNSYIQFNGSKVLYTVFNFGGKLYKCTATAILRMSLSRPAMWVIFICLNPPVPELFPFLMHPYKLCYPSDSSSSLS